MSVACAPSCGLDQLGRRVAAALERARISPRDRIVVTSGGCASFVADSIEGAHHRVPLGRSLPFGLGLASAAPSRAIYVFLGDGEAAGVGGNHLIHAARRGDRIRTLVVNNEVLGGPGGFPSPTTPLGGRTAATPSGSTSPGLDLAALAGTAGAAWVGREIVSAGESLDALLEEFATATPFAFLEIVAPCYPAFGRWNGFASPEAMREALAERALAVGRLWPRREALP